MVIIATDPLVFTWAPEISSGCVLLNRLPAMSHQKADDIPPIIEIIPWCGKELLCGIIDDILPLWGFYYLVIRPGKLNYYIPLINCDGWDNLALHLLITGRWRSHHITT